MKALVKKTTTEFVVVEGKDSKEVLANAINPEYPCNVYINPKKHVEALIARSTRTGNESDLIDSTLVLHVEATVESCEDKVVESDTNVIKTDMDSKPRKVKTDIDENEIIGADEESE
jgi:hypothetical protein